MTYIICEPCIGVCDKACVEECPVDFIQPRDGYDDVLYVSRLREGL